MEREINKSKTIAMEDSKYLSLEKRSVRIIKKEYETVIVKAQDYFLPVRVTAILPLQC